MSTKIELYGKLREHIPDEAARAIAEEMPVESDLATNDKLTQVDERLNARMDRLDERLNARMDRLELKVEAQINDLKGTLWRWQLTFFVPLWIGVYATLAAIVLRG